MKIQNNKIKTTTIVAFMVIGLIMLSPTTVIPNVGATDNVQTKYTDIPSVPATIADQLENITHKAREQIHNHPGWEAVVSWEGSNVKISYVGPMGKSPFYKPQLHHSSINSVKSGMRPFDASGGTTIYEAYAQPNSYTYSSTTYYTAVHMEQKHAAKALSAGTVDLLQTLNSLNVDQSHWMQGSIMYDDALILGSTAGWYANFDSWSTSGSEDTSLSFPQALSITASSGDTIFEDNYANNDGTYSLDVYDYNQNSGQSMNVNYGDSGANLNLDIPSGSSFAAYGGSDMEEIENSSGQSDQSWGGAVTYYLKFWATSSQGSPVASCNSWTVPNDYPATVSDNTSTCYDTMSY
ncbi:MAG: hypothetical protein LV477_03585 [Candidatus Nitrosotalea sp.]|nr:hypothetical protein [Candidatus Nitrosotalea sp.]